MHHEHNPRTKALGYVWFLESIKEKKKNIKENFLMFGITIENMKENQI